MLSAAPLFLPPFLWATAWQSVSSRTWSSLYAAAFLMALALFPIPAALAGIGFAHVDPSLEEDALTLAGEAQVFRRVTLGLARPLIAIGFLLVFLLTLSEFGVPALMQVNVYPVAIYTAFSSLYDFGQAAVLCVPLLTIATVLALAIHRAMRRTAFESLADRWQPRRFLLARSRGLAVTGIVTVGLALLIGIPLASLARKAGDPHVWEDARDPLLWSLVLSAFGATILTILGLLVAWLCQREHAPGSRWWLQSQLPLLVLPSAVVGLGLVSLWNRPAFGWLYGTQAMVALGYAARYGPLLVLVFAAFLAQIPRECEEAIWVDGGGAAVTFTKFAVPVSRRALILLGAMSFILCTGELATTILISPPGVQTLAVRLFTIEANAPQARTASLALVLALTCLAPLILCGVLLRKKPNE
jgi:iron(III) transport system permease protein